MLILQASRDDLLNPLQTVIGIVERRHILPLLRQSFQVLHKFC